MNQKHEKPTVMQLANSEAAALGHDYLGTEHILLGLAGFAGTVAAAALACHGVRANELRSAIARIVITATPTECRTHKPQTPRAKKVIEYAMEEACALGHHYIGPEHVLLGLLRIGDGVGVQAVRSLGASPELIRRTVLDGLEQT